MNTEPPFGQADEFVDEILAQYRKFHGPWSEEKHADGDLAVSAAELCLLSRHYDRRRQLVLACALILSELARLRNLKRLEPPEKP